MKQWTTEEDELVRDGNIPSGRTNRAAYERGVRLGLATRHYDRAFLIDIVSETLALDSKFSYKDLAKAIGYNLESVRQVALSLGYGKRRGIKGTCQAPNCIREGVLHFNKDIVLCATHYNQLGVYKKLTELRWERGKKRKCSIDGCDSYSRSRGMCSTHYESFWYYKVRSVSNESIPPLPVNQPSAVYDTDKLETEINQHVASLPPDVRLDVSQQLWLEVLSGSLSVGAIKKRASRLKNWAKVSARDRSHRMVLSYEEE